MRIEYFRNLRDDYHMRQDQTIHIPVSVLYSAARYFTTFIFAAQSCGNPRGPPPCHLFCHAYS